MNIKNHGGLFLDNCSTDEYYDIIQRAILENRKKYNKSNVLYVYYESHHVLPKSIFPQYRHEKWNKVLLTAQEHLCCHQLLVNMLSKGKAYYQMIRAYHAMTTRKTEDMARATVTPEEYEKLKILFSESQTLLGQRPCTEITKERIGIANKGRKPSEKAIKNSVNARLGKKKSADAVRASALAQVGNTNVRGKSWWNDGTNSTMSVTQPGPDWMKGRVFRS